MKLLLLENNTDPKCVSSSCDNEDLESVCSTRDLLRLLATQICYT